MKENYIENIIKYLHVFYDNDTFFISFKDYNLKYRYLNQSFLSFFGYNEIQNIENSSFFFHHVEESLLKMDKEIFFEKKIMQFEGMVDTPQGTRYLYLNKRPIVIDSEIIGIFSQGIDLHAHYSELIKLKNNLFDSLPVSLQEIALDIATGMSYNEIAKKRNVVVNTIYDSVKEIIKRIPLEKEGQSWQPAIIDFFKNTNLIKKK